ncbi:hypothetical protein BH24ACT14_BH24ACT14_01440 [soil metagenome]
MRIEDVDQAGTVAQWLGVEMFFRMLDSKTTRRLVGRAGFKLVKSSVEERAEDGHNIPYVCSLAEKPADYAAEQSSRYCEIFTALEILQCASSGGV